MSERLRATCLRSTSANTGYGPWLIIRQMNDISILNNYNQQKLRVVQFWGVGHTALLFVL